MSDSLAKQLNPQPLTHEAFVAACIALANGHLVKGSWPNRDQNGYYVGIAEEVGELAEAISGDHDHPPQLELMQIVACCINMHRKFYAVDPAQAKGGERETVTDATGADATSVQSMAQRRRNDTG